MVKSVKKESKTYYQCEACEMYYLEEEIATKCEEFCTKHKSCNTELINQAVKLND